MFLFILALLLMVACVIGKGMAVALIQKYEALIRRCQQKLFDASGRAKYAQQRYVIVQKAEGVAVHRVSTLKYRLSSLEEQIAQVELYEIKQELEKEREVGIVLDQVVRRALSQVGSVDEGRIQEVMRVITTLIDLEKQGSADEMVTAIREKLIQMKEAQTVARQEQPPPAPASSDTPLPVSLSPESPAVVLL
jgi:dTDP-4-amino-4,6-dideoxygalactose transaminase